MSANALFVHHPEAVKYRFNDEHPFNPIRLTLSLDLLQACEALPLELLEVPAPATETQLASVHREDYLRIVKALSAPAPAAQWTEQAQQYGLLYEDTPYFSGMHHAASILAGGTLHAANTVMSGQCKHAFHMAGGLHHAFPDRGSGFCIYNDAAVAIRHLRSKYNARVLYIDTDVHHGDGVQWVFYDDPDVCTYSIHETGKFLFPGTGYVHEKGTAEGFGTCYNLPLEAYTEDDSWLECFTDSVNRIAAAFKPDIIISQHGCDAHAYDPLSHLQCSMQIYQEIPSVIHQLAHHYAAGRWVALGGGGYDLYRVVPRAWSLVWLEMIDHPITQQLRQQQEKLLLPEPWVKRWSAASPYPLPQTWLDDKRNWQQMPRRALIAEANRALKEIVLQGL